jgi:hypothetical protein
MKELYKEGMIKQDARNGQNPSVEKPEWKRPAGKRTKQQLNGE